MQAATILRRYSIQIGVTCILLALLALFMVLSPKTFLASRIYISFLSTIPFTTLLAVGLTFCIVSGEMDISFPAVMALSGLIFAMVFKATGSPLLGLIACLATGMVAGLGNGVLVVGFGVPSIIATIGTQFLWRGLAVVLADGLARNIVDVRDTWIHSVFVGRLWDVIPAQAIWCLLLCVAAWLILNRHVYGDSLLFIGDNIRTARMTGVSVSRERILLFAGMGLISAFVSFLICLEMANWWPTMGEGYMLLVFASVFIGGTSVFGGKGTIYGTAIGSIIIGIIEAGVISSGLSGFWTRLVYGMIIVISVSIYALTLKTRRE
ncbi:ABC transporter permease [Halodesulfovibrio sp.]|jgi:simple sugar transport system permease protein|uniref:ABC transporter permease n=1 Tax=Halodesulfovibrio sp. TaxID=1912772 RepID=UPI0025D0786A|nr:ABC transporter permease [Halodesulfovibrio sp.]MCT4534445.1 ABC transporter permease [Halodesulfovibrio sp.]